MASYVGITIGPIFEVLQMAEYPAGLWYSSTSFSELTRLLLCEITKELPDADIISPYYNGEKYNDGIGRYHDRIVFATSTPEKVKDIINAAKNTFIDMIIDDLKYNDDSRKAAAKEYFKAFYQVHYVVVSKSNKGKNILLEISPLLDAIECMPVCNPYTIANPIKGIIANKGTDSVTRNKYVKECNMLKGVKGSQLYRDSEALKSIEDICGKQEGFKRSSYFAIVSADGDGISDFISKMDEGQIKSFSEDCFTFTKQAANMIGEFGGMTIYAGGDDLLFFAPIVNNNKTIFELCNSLSDSFSKTVAKDCSTPTLSLGVAIRFVRFPLYEALDSAFEALKKAKNSREEKNSMFFDIQKHSGQTTNICVTKEGFELFNDIILRSMNQSDDVVNSIIYTLDSFGSSLDFKGKNLEERIKNLFLNKFDNLSQKQYKDYIEELAEKFYSYSKNSELVKIYIDGKFDDISPLKCFEGMLRIGKFLVEKGVKK